MKKEKKTCVFFQAERAESEHQLSSLETTISSVRQEVSDLEQQMSRMHQADDDKSQAIQELSAEKGSMHSRPLQLNLANDRVEKADVMERSSRPQLSLTRYQQCERLSSINQIYQECIREKVGKRQTQSAGSICSRNGLILFFGGEQF